MTEHESNPRPRTAPARPDGTERGAADDATSTTAHRPTEVRRSSGEDATGSGEDERAARAAGREPAQRLPPHREGQTTPQRDEQRVDQQPHERDESSSSQQGAPTEVMRQAHDDVQRGVADTSRGEASDATYRRELRDGAPDAKAAGGRPSGSDRDRAAPDDDAAAARDGDRSIGPPGTAGDRERPGDERRPAEPRRD